MQRVPPLRAPGRCRLGRSPRASSSRCSTATDRPTARAYDCIIGVSGGKDSTTQTIRMLELGMNPLCVTATTDELSDIGRRNIENLKSLGVDFVEYTTNQIVRRRVNQLALMPGRRHLVARARDHLHVARADRGADGHQAHRVGREPAERVRRPGGGRDRQHARPAVGSRSSAACSGCASATSWARPVSSRSTSCRTRIRPTTTSHGSA